jgi:hypothetical protein
VRGAPDPSQKFQFFRGIPTYHESRDDFVVGVDLLAVQQAAYRAYGHLQEQRGEAESARAFFKKAADVRALIHGPWWDERSRRFYSHVLQGDRFEGASETLLVNGRPTKATVEKGPLGRAMSWARVVVGGGRPCDGRSAGGVETGPLRPYAEVP